MKDSPIDLGTKCPRLHCDQMSQVLCVLRLKQCVNRSARVPSWPTPTKAVRSSITKTANKVFAVMKWLNSDVQLQLVLAGEAELEQHSTLKSRLLTVLHHLLSGTALCLLSHIAWIEQCDLLSAVTCSCNVTPYLLVHSTRQCAPLSPHCWH